MKKLFFCILCSVSAAVCVLNATETTLYSEEFTCSDDWSSGYALIEKSALSGAVAGDEINVYVTAISTGTQWPQVYLQFVNASWAWVDFVDTHNYGLAEQTAPHTATIELTQTMLDSVAAGNYLVVKGAGYTANKITLTHTPSEAGTTQSIWSGSGVMPSNWGAWQTLEASKFANAEVGQLLRCRFTDLGSNAQLQLKETTAWTELVDAPLALIRGRYYDYTITADMLAELKAHGVIVSGCNYTLIEVLLINPADLKTLTLSVPVTEDWVFAAKPSITIHVENPYDEAVTANAEIEIATDKAAIVTTFTKSVEVAAKASEDIVLTTDADLAAGFYRATCIVNDDLARAFVFGINPTAIVSAPDTQSDFADFWATAKAQLEAIDMNATLTEITAKSTDARKVYLVELNSVPDGLTGEPVVVRGYYCEPTDGKKHPVIMHYMGYDSGYRVVRMLSPTARQAMPSRNTPSSTSRHAVSASTTVQPMSANTTARVTLSTPTATGLPSTSATKTATTTAVHIWTACKLSASWQPARRAICATCLPRDRARAVRSPTLLRHSPNILSALSLLA